MTASPPPPTAVTGLPADRTAARLRGACRVLTLLAVLAATGGASLALADTDADRARAALRSGEILPLARILDTVSRQYAGDVIDVKLDRDDGIWQYEVKLLLPTGSVAKLEYDARDARLLKAKGHDLDRARKP
ncbi:hypothetical protein D9X30_1848 [Cupriavidus sp. U2]|uniref:PepSY domain-containing protein n=1 Tax=Cupriavidus sp. U2 TaxID=2920269 RepID=UPI001E478596|nr:hypothetical protein [Cupriavidus sp. U2]KAI3592977.1 hypothetical protein D9X30_1848 [Cupriavidus sp. U2]